MMCKISQDEIAYLCELSAQYFQQKIKVSDVCWAYSGVRALSNDGHADAKAITRDFRLDFCTDGAPHLNVFGGKITTYRVLAEQAVDQIVSAFSDSRILSEAWTAQACLPGGDIAGAEASNDSVRNFKDFVRAAEQKYSWVSSKIIQRYAHVYGTRLHQILANCHKVQDLGEEILPGVFAKEIKYLMEKEWAQCADDILWRRSKLGLHLPKNANLVLDNWIARQQFKFV